MRFSRLLESRQAPLQNALAMILAIANQKGGVGKTTTAINLAAALAMRKHPTLLIDLDPQSNSTMSFLDARQLERTMFDAMIDEAVGLAGVIKASNVPCLSVAPARISLAKLEAKLVGEIDAHFRLRDRLDRVREDYESVVIDCPPTLGLLTVNALVAATHLLIPIQSSYFALEGTDDLLETVDKVRARANPALKIVGVLITMHDRRTSIARDSTAADHQGLRAEGLQHGDHQEREAGGESGLQGIDLHVRPGVLRGGRVLQPVRGGHRSCPRRGLPETVRMRHDEHYVEALSSSAGQPIGQDDPDRANRSQSRPASAGDGRPHGAHGVDLPRRASSSPSSSGSAAERFQIVAGERRYQAAVQVGLIGGPGRHP